MQDTVSLPRWSVRRMRLPIGSGSRSSSIAPPTLSSRRAATPPGKDAYCPLVVGTCGSVSWFDCSMEFFSLTAPETRRGKRGKSSMRRVSRPEQLAGRRRGGYRGSGTLVGFLHRRHFRTPPSRAGITRLVERLAHLRDGARSRGAYSGGSFDQAAGDVLVKQARDQSLVRNPLFKGTLLKSLESPAGNPDVHSSILFERGPRVTLVSASLSLQSRNRSPIASFD